jgi:hypothetical protein
VRSSLAHPEQRYHQCSAGRGSTYCRRHTPCIRGSTPRCCCGVDTGVRNSAGRRMAVPRGQQRLVMDMQDRQQPSRARSPCTARRESIPSCVVTQRTQWTSFVSPFLHPPPPSPPAPQRQGPVPLPHQLQRRRQCPPGPLTTPRTSPSLPTATSATAPKTMPPRATHHTPYLAFSAHCQISTLRLPNIESDKNHCVCPPHQPTKKMLFVPLRCVWWRWM